MNWSTLQSEYEGFPLFLRKPDYPDIYQFKSTYPQIVAIRYTLEKVRPDGLPEPEYNLSTMDLDLRMLHLFDSTEGIVFLVETFGGKRAYYYFVVEDTDFKSKVKQIKNEFKGIKFSAKSWLDEDWDFLSEYPVRLY